MNLKRYIFLREKKQRFLLVKLCFFLHFIPLEPDPRTQMNPDPHHWLKTSLLFYFRISGAEITFVISEMC